jgi:DNA-binding transcriptional MerR regulator
VTGTHLRGDAGFVDQEDLSVIDRPSGFNLKAVVQETGLNAETLRAWERRYGLPKPERTPGGHRLYTLRDIQMLNWIAARQKKGMRISRAIEHWRDLESNGQDPLSVYASQGQPGGAGGVMLAELCLAWVGACLDFDEQAAERALAEAFALYAPEVVCFDLLRKGLSIIGSSWYEGKSSVQQEHFASGLAMRKLHNLSTAAPAPNRPGRILAACPAGEEHEFGLLLLAVLLRRRGWEVVYLGANVPLLQLESALRASAPYLVVSVAQTLPAAASLRQMGEFLTAQGVRLAYDGGIINAQPSIQNLIPGFHLGGTFNEAVQMVERLWNLKPPIQQAQPTPPDHQQALQRYAEFHAQIEIFVFEAMRGEGIVPAHLETALKALHQHLAAALALGDIRLVQHSLGWLEGLMDNYNLPKTLLTRLLEHYQSAIETYIPPADQAVFFGPLSRG